jgi:hypothetical protein
MASHIQKALLIGVDVVVIPPEQEVTYLVNKGKKISLLK